MAEADRDRDQWFAQLQRHTMESDKSRRTALCLSVLLGWAGADRFYLGYAWLGTVKFATFGGLAVWWIVDVILLAIGSTKDADGGILRARPVK